MSKKWTAESVAEATTRLILNTLGVDESELTPDATLVEDLGGDSLDLVELALSLEEEFGIAVEDAEIEPWGTTSVKDLIAFVCAKVGV